MRQSHLSFEMIEDLYAHLEYLPASHGCCPTSGEIRFEVGNDKITKGVIGIANRKSACVEPTLIDRRDPAIGIR